MGGFERPSPGTHARKQTRRQQDNHGFSPLTRTMFFLQNMRFAYMLGSGKGISVIPEQNAIPWQVEVNSYSSHPSHLLFAFDVCMRIQ